MFVNINIYVSVITYDNVQLEGSFLDDLEYVYVNLFQIIFLGDGQVIGKVRRLRGFIEEVEVKGIIVDDKL